MRRDLANGGLARAAAGAALGTLATLATLATGAAPARADGGDDAAPTGRDGFTVQLDGGGGAILVQTTGSTTPTYRWAIAGLDLGLGAFVTRDLAVMFRFAAQTFYVSPAQSSAPNHILAHTFAGLAVEDWIDDRVFLGGGAGLAVFGGQDQDGSNGVERFGWGANARGGVALSSDVDSGWRLSLELGYGRTSGEQVWSGSLLLGWQSY